MSQRTRNFLILIGVITILSLATVAIGPVLAQTGSSGGGTVSLQSGDTLGSIVSRYHLSGNSLRSFFSKNQSLNLTPGQTVTFPAGMAVNLPANSQSSSSSSSTTSQTYVTQSGDTLGSVLGFMGFSASANSSGTPTTSATQAATATSAATAAATEAATATSAATQAATATTAATAAATTAATPTSAATSAATPAATTAATPAATTAATPAATTASNSSNGSVGPALSAPTDSQLQQFVQLNQGLTFASGQSITLPSGIAVTGNSNNGATTTYTVQSGDTLQSLANKFGITLAQLLALNPNLLTPGMTINVPSSSGSIPQTGSKPQSFTIKNQETLGQLESILGLGAGQMTSFFTANCNVTVVPGQRVLFPIAIAGQGSTGTQQFTYTTKQGDTLCTLVNMMGLNLSQGASSSSSSSSSAAAATATPEATVAATATAEATTAATPTTAATMAATPTTAATTAATPTTAATTAAMPTTAATSAATPTVAATSAATPTTAATTAATPTAEATTAATPTTAATTAASSNSSSTTASGNVQGAYANNQEGLLREFFKFNRNLKLENGQTVTMGNVIPATGGSSSTTSNSTSSNTSSSNTTSSSAANTASAAAAVNPSNSNAFSCDIPKGRGLYRIGSGETLTSIANRFGVTVQQILDVNPGRTAYAKGDVIFMPAVEAPGLWNMTALGCNDAPNPAVNTTSR